MSEALPDAILEERLAIVGTSGSGKTYAAKGAVETLIARSDRLCVVDPLGVWWGLRAGADGSAKGGLPVTVIGGLHGDMPLQEHDGTALGRLIGTRSVQCVLDLSELDTEASQRRFMVAFLDALYRSNREPLHLVLDEADQWAPQRAMPDQALLQNRVSKVVRRGRVFGLITWLITQRPAVLSKDVLSQAKALIALNLTLPHDRKAIGAWIEGNADPEQGKRILASLAELRRGEGYVWAPGHGVLQQQHFPPIRTFDSSRTPKRGERLAGPTGLAKVDVAAIAAELAAAAPADARAGKGKTADVAATTAELEESWSAGRAEGHAAGRAESEQERQHLRDEIAGLRAAIEAAAGHLMGAHRPDALSPLPPAALRVIEGAVAPAPAPASAAPARRQPRPEPAKGGGAELRPLRALAARHPARLTEAQWATLAGMKRTGGTWGTYKSRLRVRDLIEQQDGLWGVTKAGLKAAGEAGAPQPQSPQETRTMWAQALGTGPGRMMEALLARPLARSALAAAVGMEKSGGTFGTYLSRLRANGLVRTDGKLVELVEELRDA